MDKNTLYDTDFSYQASPKEQSFIQISRTMTNVDKENIVPCVAQIQAFVTTLNQKKHQLKNLMV